MNAITPPSPGVSRGPVRDAARARDEGGDDFEIALGAATSQPVHAAPATPARSGASASGGRSGEAGEPDAGASGVPGELAAALLAAGDAIEARIPKTAGSVVTRAQNAPNLPPAVVRNPPSGEPLEPTAREAAKTPALDAVPIRPHEAAPAAVRPEGIVAARDATASAPRAAQDAPAIEPQPPAADASVEVRVQAVSLASPPAPPRLEPLPPSASPAPATPGPAPTPAASGARGEDGGGRGEGAGSDRRGSPQRPADAAGAPAAPAPAPAGAANADLAAAAAAPLAARGTPAAPALRAPVATAPTAPLEDPRLEPMRRAADQVTLQFQGEDGLEGRVRVSVRGDTVHAAILTSDEGTLQRFGAETGTLHRALGQQGFTQTRVSVHDTRTAGTTPAPDARHDARTGNEQRRQGESQRRSGQGRESRQGAGSQRERRAPQQERPNE